MTGSAIYRKMRRAWWASLFWMLMAFACLMTLAEGSARKWPVAWILPVMAGTLLSFVLAEIAKRRFDKLYTTFKAGGQ